ncbi:MAG: histidine phosphatase family protein [Sandaracinaceae bacterium]
MHRSYFFVRHGRAVYQEPGFDHRDYPRGTDWPLAPVGHDQARAVRAPLLRRGVERVVSSRLERAKQTAGYIAADTLPYDHRWDALNELEPKKLRRSRKQRPEWVDGVAMARAMRAFSRGRPTGEWDIEGVAQRVDDVLERLDALAEPRLAVVCHGFWIWMLAVRLGGPPRIGWVDNTSVTRVDADGRGRRRLVSFAARL